MRIIKYLFFILIVFFTISCEKYIDMELPDKGRKLVVNSFITNDDSITVELSKSVFILENSLFEPIKNANISLINRNETFSDFKEISDGKYVLKKHNLKEGSICTLLVSRDENKVKATTTIPHKVKISFVDSLRFNKQGLLYFRMKFRIDDPQEKNYYLLSVLIEDSTINLTKPTHASNQYPDLLKSLTKNPILVSNDPIKYIKHRTSLYFSSDEKFIENFYNTSAIFTDDLFNNSSRIISLDFNAYDFYREKNKVIVQLHSLSKDMYLYLLTLIKHNESNFSPFAEPVMVYNNIEGGLGIFAGYSTYTITFDIPFIASNIYYEQ